jgi:hypothetical protein
MDALFYGKNYLQETPRGYSSSARQNFVYEISLRTKDRSPWLSDLLQAHRLVQALTQGQLLEQYELLDFLIWPEGFFLRVRLQNIPTLSDFLEFLKEKTTVGGTATLSWEDELQWIRPIPPERLAESTRLFLQNAEQIQSQLKSSGGQSPSLFFFYRNSRLVR